MPGLFHLAFRKKFSNFVLVWGYILMFVMMVILNLIDNCHVGKQKQVSAYILDIPVRTY